MRRYWLKMIGNREFPCPLDHSYEFVDSRQPMQDIQKGDGMILYAVGRGKRLFAHAHVTREVYKSGDDDWPNRVDIAYDDLLDVRNGVVIDRIVTNRDLLRPIKWGKSYFPLTAEEYEQAVALLQAANVAVCG
jgi:hypothetical protein